MKLILLFVSVLTIFTACNNGQEPKYGVLNQPKVNPFSFKPEIITTFKSAAYPSIFEASFISNTKVKQGDFNFEFYKHELGKIKVVSGKVIACDPVVMFHATPFTQKFPIGEFPVHLAMAKINKGESVAFSRIVFTDEAVDKWEFALMEGQKPISLKDSNYYCYGVDAATGIFIDSAANDLYNKKAITWDAVFVDKAEKYGYKGFIHDFDGHNFATFTTGFGDGCYSTYIGFDKHGNVCQLLTDFGLVSWSLLDE